MDILIFCNILGILSDILSTSRTSSKMGTPSARFRSGSASSQRTMTDDPFHVNLRPKDVDSWNFMCEPTMLLKMFGKFTTMQLVSHAPHTKEHEAFKDWPFIAQGPCLMRVHPKFKLPLLDVMLKCNYTVYKSTYSLAFIEGSQMMTLYDLVRFMEFVDVDVVRIQAYGMKFLLPDRMIPIGDPELPMASTNSFDLGRNFSDTLINLVRWKSQSGADKETWPMLLNLGQGFGSVRATFNFRGSKFIVKIYPILVHCIKSTSGKMQTFDGNTFGSLRKRETTYLKRIDKLENFPKINLGGSRVEVTVQAPTLQHAYAKVASTPLLNIYEYLTPTQEEMKFLELDIKFIKKRHYIQYCRDIMEKAQKLGVFKGDNRRKPGNMRKQIVSDLYNAMGWNPGTRAVTLFAPKRRVVHVQEPITEVPPPFQRAARTSTEVQRSTEVQTNIISIPWWDREFVGDVDAPPQASGTSIRGYLSPLSVEANLKEIERCCKIIKVGSTWSPMVYNDDRKIVALVHTATKKQAVNYIYVKYLREWHKHCYLIQKPFQALPEVPDHPAVAGDLDLELQKFDLPDETALPSSATFSQLQGTSTIKITHRYITADGNCQFRALAWAKWGNQGRYKVARRKVVEYLKTNPDMLLPILGSDVVSPSCKDCTEPEEYIDQMAKDKTWGDNATLSAACQILELNLIIINQDGSYFKVSHTTLRHDPETKWHALFYTGDHYEVVVKDESAMIIT